MQFDINNYNLVMKIVLPPDKIIFNNKTIIFLIKQLLFYFNSLPVTLIVFFNACWIVTLGNFIHNYVIDISWMSQIFKFLLGFPNSSISNNIDLNVLVSLFVKISFFWYFFSSLLRYLLGKKVTVNIKTQIFFVTAITFIGNVISIVYLRHIGDQLFWVVLIFFPISIGANIFLIFLNNLNERIEQIK